MSDPTQPPLAADASQDEIEADIAATRARLAESVDALADKMDVKAQAKDKVADVKAQATGKVTEVKNTAQAKVLGAKVAAQEKIADLKATAQDKIADVRGSTQDKVGHAGATPTPTGIPTTPQTVAGPGSGAPSRAAGPVPSGPADKVVATSRQLLARLQTLPLAGQIAAAAMPLLVAVLLVERRRKA